MMIAPELDFAPCGQSAAPCSSGAPLPPNEVARLQALRDYAILDTAPEQAFDRITRLAATVFAVPIAIVSLVDAERQWFKSSVGLDVCETHWDVAFCPHAILTEEVMIVPDTAADPRFAANPLVTGAPHIRFYAGAPLRTASGFHLGTLCIIDRVPREFGAAQAAMLADFAAIVSEAMEERLAKAELLASRAFLQSTQAELRILFDFLPAEICFKDTENRILRANRRLAESIGKTISEIEGKPTAEIFPEEADKFFADDLEVIRSGVPKLGIIESFRNAEGREFWIQTDKAPVFDHGGKVIGIIAMAQDVTLRRRADEELRLLSSAVAQSTESIVITDADLDSPGPRIVFVNPAFTKMTGYSAEESLGQSPRKLQGPETDQSGLRRLRQSLECGEAFTGEAINYRKDGAEFVVEWQIAPIRNAAEKITHFVAIQRDITERKRAEAELADTQRQLVVASRQAGMAEVATGVLHNVGNVLNSVNVSSTLVSDAVRKSKVGDLQRVVALLDTHAADLGAFVSSDPQGKNLAAYLRQLHERLRQEQKTVLAEVEALRGNIDHIKDIVAMQQSYATFSGVTEVVELSDLVEDALRMNSSSLHRHDVRVVREFEQIPSVSVDKHRVLQILVNLVRNARQACDESGGEDKRLTFRVTNGQEHVRVAVTDNGVGIAPENLTRIFAHGFTTKKNGHGFGLHSSALAATEMGGTLRVHSDGPGHGATFTLELPLPTELSQG